MFGWVGELASAFSSAGLEGLVLLALLIISILLIRSNSRKSDHMRHMHDGMVKALDSSSEAHRGVSRVLGRIEGILGIRKREP